MSVDLWGKGASLVARLVKNLPAVQETWVRPLGWEDPPRRERLPTPVFWSGEFHGLYSPWGRKESDTTERLTLHCRACRVGCGHPRENPLTNCSWLRRPPGSRDTEFGAQTSGFESRLRGVLTASSEDHWACFPIHRGPCPLAGRPKGCVGPRWLTSVGESWGRIRSKAGCDHPS